MALYITIVRDASSDLFIVSLNSFICMSKILSRIKRLKMYPPPQSSCITWLFPTKATSVTTPFNCTDIFAGKVHNWRV